MTTISQPHRCPFCKQMLTLADHFSGQCCTDPAHWQAAGVLSTKDYYALAQLAAKAVAQRLSGAQTDMLLTHHPD